MGRQADPLPVSTPQKPEPEPCSLMDEASFRSRCDGCDSAPGMFGQCLAWDWAVSYSIFFRPVKCLGEIWIAKDPIEGPRGVSDPSGCCLSI